MSRTKNVSRIRWRSIFIVALTLVCVAFNQGRLKQIVEKNELFKLTEISHEDTGSQLILVNKKRGEKTNKKRGEKTNKKRGEKTNKKRGEKTNKKRGEKTITNENPSQVRVDVSKGQTPEYPKTITVDENEKDKSTKNAKLIEAPNAMTNSSFMIKRHIPSKEELKKSSVEDISWMLDYAIIGWPKTGTTTLMNYLNTDELFAPRKEIHLARHGKKLMQVIINNYRTLIQKKSEEIDYKNLSLDTKTQLWGFKCPFVFHHTKRKALLTFTTDFPHVKLVVGLRHPVLWFESYWNHVGLFEYGKKFKKKPVPVNSTFGLEKRLGNFGGDTSLDTNMVRYHEALSRLGKTLPWSEEQLELLPEDFVSGEFVTNPSLVPKSVNKVFIYELGQLEDDDPLRTTQFREDLGKFIGVTKPLPPIVKVDPNKFKEGGKRQSSITDAMRVDICDGRLVTIRERLLEEGIKSQEWIKRFFLESEDVTMSSREYFEKLLEGWKIDPCEERQRRKGVEQ